MADEVIIDENGSLLRPGTVEHWHANARRGVGVSPPSPRPSFSHGRGKSVVVEFKRARVLYRPSAPPDSPAGAATPAGRDGSATGGFSTGGNDQHSGDIARG